MAHVTSYFKINILLSTCFPPSAFAWLAFSISLCRSEVGTLSYTYKDSVLLAVSTSTIGTGSLVVVFEQSLSCTFRSEVIAILSNGEMGEIDHGWDCEIFSGSRSSHELKKVSKIQRMLAKY